MGSLAQKEILIQFLQNLPTWVSKCVRRVMWRALALGIFKIVIFHLCYHRLCILDEFPPDILRQRTSDVEVKRYCVKLLEKFGSFQYTRNILLDIDKEVRTEVAKLGDNPLMISLVDELLSWDSMKENI